MRFEPDVLEEARQRIRSLVGARLLRRLPLPGAEVIALAEGTSVTAARGRLAAHPEVAYAEPDFVYRVSATLPDDPWFSSLWGLHVAANTDIDAPEAWSSATGTRAVRVGVVDTGVAYDHPDLAPNIWTNAREVAGNGIDDDNNGYVDDLHGWDWVGRDNDPLDLHGHGTHVAGTIAAKGNNGKGVTGVAWNAGLVPLRVLDANGSGTSSSIVSAFSYAGKLGLEVVNASLGGPSYSQAVLDSIRSSPGTLFVVAAGNETSDNDAVPSYPCNYEIANILCVAATTRSDGLASFSNYGASSVDLGAPGSGIVSTLPKIETRFRDGFESALAERWSAGGTGSAWDLASDVHGSYLADTPGASYVPETDAMISLQERFDLAAARGCRLRYALRLDTEKGRDLLSAEASEDGAAWSRIGATSGSTQGQWSEISLDLSAFDGRMVYLRFRLTSDANTTVGAGADIDDIEVRCIGTSYTGSEAGTFSGTSMAAPHAAGAAAILKSAEPGLDATSLKTALIEGTVATAALHGRTVSGGRLNLARSLSLVAPIPIDEAPVAGDPSPAPTFTQSEQVVPESDAPLPSPSPSGEESPVTSDTPFPTPTPTAGPTPDPASGTGGRSIGLRLRRHLVAVGAVASSEIGCRSRVRIVVKRNGTRVAVTRTDADGTFRLRLSDRVGRYAVVAAATDGCPRAIARARHAHASVAAGSPEQEAATVSTTGDRCWTYRPRERRMHDLLIGARRELGLERLRLDPELSRVARLHASEMARATAVFHTPSETLKGRVLEWNELAENIGTGKSADSLHESFMAASIHRDNIVHKGFTNVGVGIEQGEGRVWVTVLFQGGEDPGTTLPMPICRS